MAFIDTVKGLFKNYREVPSIEFIARSGSERERQLKEFVCELYKEADEYYLPYRNEWLSNKMAYLGIPKSQFGGQDASPDLTGTMKSFVSCFVADKIEDLTAIQLAGRPIMTPMPLASRDLDVNLLQEGELASEFVRKIWKFCFQDLLERRKIHTLDVMNVICSRLCGFAPVKIFQSYDYETQQQDIFLELVTPEDFLVEPAATMIYPPTYVFHRAWKNPYWLLKRYPDKKDMIIAALKKSETASATKSAKHEREKEKYKRLVCVAEMYVIDETAVRSGIVEEEAEPIYPSGRRILFLPDVEGILKEGANPYSKFPFAVYVPRPIYWRFVGRNEASPLSSIQTLADMVIQQMVGNLRKVGNSKMIYERNNVPDPELIDNSLAEKIPVERLGAIQWVNAMGITGDAISAYRMLEQAARSISGIEAPSEGATTGSLTSGVAIAQLIESVNRKIRIQQDLFSEYNVDRGKQMADIMIDVYKKGRRLRVADENELPVILPADLKDITESIDVKVDSDTQLPTDPVSMVNLAISLMQVRAEDGLPLMDRQGVLEFLKIPGAREAMIRLKDLVTNQTMQGAAGFNAAKATEGMPQVAPPGQMLAFKRQAGGLTPQGRQAVGVGNYT